MYGIFAYIYHKNQPNVVEYTIHGSYGLGSWNTTEFSSEPGVVSQLQSTTGVATRGELVFVNGGTFPTCFNKGILPQMASHFGSRESISIAINYLVQRDTPRHQAEQWKSSSSRVFSVQWVQRATGEQQLKMRHLQQNLSTQDVGARLTGSAPRVLRRWLQAFGQRLNGCIGLH